MSPLLSGVPQRAALGPIGMSEENGRVRDGPKSRPWSDVRSPTTAGVEEIEGVARRRSLRRPGMPIRQAVGARQARVRGMMHTLPPAARQDPRDEHPRRHPQIRRATIPDDVEPRHRQADEAPTGRIPVPGTGER